MTTTLEANGTPKTRTLRENPTTPQANFYAYATNDLKVPETVYVLLREQFPEAWDSTNPHSGFYLRFLNFFLGCRYFDDQTAGLIIPCQLVAFFAGKDWDANFVAGEWLDVLEDVFGSRLNMCRHAHSYPEHRARTLHCTLVENIETAYRHAEMQRLDNRASVKYVCLSNGKPNTRRKREAEKDRIKAIRQAAIEDVRNDETRQAFEGMQFRFISIINRHQTDHGRMMCRLLRAALPEAARYWKGEYREQFFALDNQRDENQKLHALRQYFSYGAIMVAIDTMQHTEHFYGGGTDTPRIFAKGAPNAHQLPRPLRKACLRHLTTLDLDHVQLAVIVQLWGLPQLKSFLQECQQKNVKAWDAWLIQIGITDTELRPIVKAILKTGFCYPCVFGMLDGNFAAEMQKVARQDCPTLTSSQTDGIIAAILADPLAQEIIAGRKKHLRQIREAGGLRLTAWEWDGLELQGEFVPLDKTGTCQQRGKAERQILAMQAQAAEVSLMLRAVEVIDSLKGEVIIVSALHDSLTLHFTDATKKARYINKITKAVNDRADKMGFITRFSRE